MMEERRESIRRSADVHKCAFHGEVETLDKRINAMSTKINVGIGLFLAGTVVVSMLLYSLDKVEAHVTEAQVKHEVKIKEDQSKITEQLQCVDTTLNRLSTDVAVLQTQFSDFKASLAEDREIILEALEEIK